VSTTKFPGDKLLKGDELGRLVMLMRRELTEAEVCSVLNHRYDQAKWRAATLDYHNSKDRITRWDCDRIDERVIAFATEHGRWPGYRDFGRPNHLPSRGVFDYHNHARHWCRGEYRRRYLAGKPYEKPEHQTFWQRIVARVAEGELSPQLVLAIPNSTIRRDAIAAAGGGSWLVEGGAGSLVQQDDYGKLWRVNWAEPNTNDWSSHFVEVVNSTPQLDEDGSVKLVKGEPVFDHYFLRVPPTINTAKEAVAWTGHFEVPRFGKQQLGEREFAGFVAQS
jgi:hypothetical protein